MQECTQGCTEGCTEKCTGPRLQMQGCTQGLHIKGCVEGWTCRGLQRSSGVHKQQCRERGAVRGAVRGAHRGVYL